MNTKFKLNRSICRKMWRRTASRKQVRFEWFIESIKKNLQKRTEPAAKIHWSPAPKSSSVE